MNVSRQLTDAPSHDNRLSFKARGILVWLLDKPDEWVTSSERIEQQGKEGREAIRSALKELEDLGYLKRWRWRDPAGKWQREWRIYETPGAATDGKPSTVTRTRKAVSGNPSHIEKTEIEAEIAESSSLSVEKYEPTPAPPELMEKMRSVLKRVK